MNSVVRDLDVGQLPRTPFLAFDRQVPPALSGLAPHRLLPVSLSDPTPRKRLVKDVLRTGQWRVGVNPQTGEPMFWCVTPETLRDLALNYARCRANGVQINLCWGHGAADRIGVDPRDLIAPIDQVFVAGNRLWVTSFVTPQQAIDLQNPVYQTSIRALENYLDGAGNHYPLALLHVAIVDHPVVGNQGPFLDMANYILALTNPPESGAQTMDEQMLTLWQRAFALLGLTLPDDADPDTLPAVIDSMLSSLESGSDAAADDTEGMDRTGRTVVTPDDGTNPYALTSSAVPGDVSHALSLMLRPMAAQLRDLANTVSGLVSEKSTAARSAYEARLNELLRRGHVRPSRKPHYLELGARHAYDLSILGLLDDARVIDMGSRARQVSTRNTLTVDAAPPVTYARPRQEDLDEGVLLLGGRK